MGISFYSRGLAVLALALGAGMAAVGAPQLAPFLSSAAASESTAPNKALGMNVGTQMMREAAAMANALGVGARHASYVKHRGPGERAHRRWRHARASGIAGAHRG